MCALLEIQADSPFTLLISTQRLGEIRSWDLIHIAMIDVFGGRFDIFTLRGWQMRYRDGGGNVGGVNRRDGCSFTRAGMPPMSPVRRNLTNSAQTFGCCLAMGSSTP